MTKENCDYCNFESMNRATLIARPKNEKDFEFVYVGNDRKIHVDGRSSKEKPIQKLNTVLCVGKN